MLTSFHAPDVETQKDNARLIVATPALLEACEDVSTWYADHFGDFSDEINEQLLCLANKLRAAIAAAKD